MKKVYIELTEEQKELVWKGNAYFMHRAINVIRSK